MVPATDLLSLEARFNPARLRRLRDLQGFTQEDLADRSGLNPNTIGRIENGLNRPRASTLCRLAEALGVAVKELFNR